MHDAHSSGTTAAAMGGSYTPRTRHQHPEKPEKPANMSDKAMNFLVDFAAGGISGAIAKVFFKK